MTGMTSKGAATRARIVNSAADLMFVHGVAGTTLEQVRAAAGVSSSQIYHYFADKDELVLAVVAHQSEAVVGPQEAGLAGLTDISGLRGWRDDIVALQRRVQCQGGCPIGTLGAELGEIDERARRGVSQGFHRWAAALRAGLANLQRLGGLPEDVDVDVLATGVLAALQGGLLLCQMHRSTAPLAAALDTAIDHVELLGRQRAGAPAAGRARLGSASWAGGNFPG